jgi:hypothetical protein
MKAKAMLLFLLPWLAIPVLYLTTPSAITLWLKLIISSELITLLVFFSAKLSCQRERDVIFSENATFIALGLAAVMFLVSLCSFFLYSDWGNNSLSLPLINEKISPSIFFMFLSAFLAMTSGIIAIMPLNSKWANIRHTTILLLASVACFGLFISSISGLEFAGPIFLIIETMEFRYAYQYTSEEEKKKEDLRKEGKSQSLYAEFK